MVQASLVETGLVNSRAIGTKSEERKKKLFESGLGTLKKLQAKIHVDPAATPKFCKARPVPYATHSKVEELDCLKNDSVIEAVKFAGWAAPISGVET